MSLVQYIILRKDLQTVLNWPLGALIGMIHFYFLVTAYLVWRIYVMPIDIERILVLKLFPAVSQKINVNMALCI